MPSSTPSSILETAPRADAVRQAVDFLAHPRVRQESLSNAVAFLRQRGLSEVEIQTAFHQSGLVYPPLPQPRNTTSWSSIVFTLAAAAGLYTAAKYAIVKYVVPHLQLEMGEDGVQRDRDRDSTEDVVQRQREIIREHQMQIEQLTSRLAELEHGRKNDLERIDTLLRSVERGRRTNSCTAGSDVIRELSHTVSESTRTDSSKRVTNVIEETSYAAPESHKMGKLSYSHGVQSRDLHATSDESAVQHSGSKRHSVESHSHTDAFSNKPLVQNGHTEAAEGDSKEEDAFMAMAPAEVQDSWRRVEGTPLTAKTDDDEQFFSPREHLPPSSQVRNVDQVDVRTDEGGFGIGGDEVAPNLGRGATASAVARRLFSADVQAQVARINAGLSPFETEKKVRSRPSSMPAMDTPLSDEDS